MNRKIIWFLISLFLLFAIIGCDDDPTSLGANLLPPQDLIGVVAINSADTTISQKSRFYDTDTLALNSSTSVLLGKYDNVESTILMKFFIFLSDSVKEAVLNNSIIIKSAVMEMEPIYTYGNNASFFDFSIHEITKDWNSLEFGKKDMPIPFEPLDLSSNREFTDSLITLDFNKDILYEWMKLSANETQEENFGLYFNFADGTDKIIGFPAISSLYDSVLTRINIIVEVPNKFTDTLNIQVTSDVHVVLGEKQTSNNENIFVQGGIPVRSNMMFDLSGIPRHAIINRATLKLFVDESESEMGTVASNFLSMILVKDFEDSEVDTYYPRISLERDSVESFYSGEITPLVQYWVSTENNGFQLYLNNEIDVVNKLAIATDKHSNNALKPYLEIIFTSKN